MESSMMRKRMLTGLIFLFILGFPSRLWAQSSASVQYVYDALGRLTTVIDPSGNVATYNYDAVGNLLSITRSTTSPSALAIFGFSPAQGSVGQTVVIQGQNFSTTPSANTVVGGAPLKRKDEFGCRTPGTGPLLLSRSHKAHDRGHPLDPKEDSNYC
jgi:YD repeat-containing protein